MLRRLQIVMYCMLAFGISYCSLNSIGPKKPAEANDISNMNGNPHHGGYERCKMCGERYIHYKKGPMALAHRAGEELLIEKIKAKLDEKVGNQLDKVADTLASALIQKYKAMKECKKQFKDFEKQIEEAFMMEGGKEGGGGEGEEEELMF
ncbi:MAG: hypothetical protein E3K32_01680 [wastewater metagenome]|nr:hypothetical protein [Candidatus Loosdrechtia aerotolerans]